MAAYLAILIPIAVAIWLFIAYRKQIVWWELAVPIASSLLFIWGFKATVEHVVTNDTEYRGSVISTARYYQYWDTWVEQTCSYEVCDGTDSKGNCTGYTTYYYDCSYCSKHEPEYKVTNEYGKRWSITKDYFTELKYRWHSTPQFVELNRNINHHGDCGTDGDAYDIFWDGKLETAESSSWEHSYKNKVQASHSTFKLPSVSKSDARKLGLYDYPAIYADYKQETILGLDTLYGADSLETIRRAFEYLNAYNGKRHHCRTYIMLFKNKPLDIALKQRAYWDGGNDNELDVCIGLDNNRMLKWVYVFTWCDNKRIAVDIRENMMSEPQFTWQRTYNVVNQGIKDHFKPKNFLDFDYLEVDMPTSSLIILYCLISAITAGLSYWSVNNKYTN